MKVKAIISIFLLILTVACSPAIAQPYSSSPANEAQFTVDAIQGCAPLTINISAPGCTDCGIFPFPPPNNNTGSKPFSKLYKYDPLPYTDPGQYTLTMLKGFTSSTITITILPNPKPTFEISACNNKGTYLKITDTNYNAYEVTYDQSTIQFPIGKRTDIYNGFPSEGPYDVKVKGIYTNAENTNCGSDVQSIYVQNNLQALNINTLTVENSSQIKLDFIYDSDPTLKARQQSTSYNLKIAKDRDNNFQTSATDVHNQNTVTVASGITADNNFYCFELAAADHCANPVTFTALSNTICSAVLNVVAQNQKNNVLSWTTNTTPGLKPLDFTVDKDPGSPVLNALPGTYSEADCGEITYQLISHYNYFGNVMTSYSLPRTVTTFSTDPPPTMENISAVVSSTGIGVELSWPVVPGEEYSIARAGSLIEKNTTGIFNDNEYTTEAGYCYQVTYENTCGSTSPDLESCPIKLSGLLNDDNSISLSWSDYKGWQNSVSSYIVKRRSGANTFEAQGTPLSGLTSFTDTDAALDILNQTYQYEIIATNNVAGLNESVSNIITITKEPDIYYPSAFTPNDNGLNDEFKVIGKYISKFEMNIFNRWGELMFHATDIHQPWDGAYKGTPMPEGTYVFVAKITDLEGRDFKKSGSVVLLKRK